jgi:DNA-binding transcriptional MerR regulator
MDAPTDAVTTLTPAAMAERTGVSLDTLRYYEREGLLTGVERAGSGHRRYDQDDVVWVEVLRCLRTSGMSIEQLRTYAALVREGPSTAQQRLDHLLRHRAGVEARIRELTDARDVIDHKIAVYRAALAEEETSR